MKIRFKKFIKRIIFSKSLNYTDGWRDARPNFGKICDKCGASKFEVKECGHEFSQVNIDTKKIYCNKCNLELDDPGIGMKWQYNGEDLKMKQDPFWLKEGDLIKEIGTDRRFKIKKISERDIDCDCIEDYSENYSSAILLKRFCTPDKFKKIKLVSPAILKNKNGTYKFTELLYSKSPVLIEMYSGAIKNFESVIWPAKDQFGKEIWYEVEEGWKY